VRSLYSPSPFTHSFRRPQFVLFELAHGEVDACLDLIGRAIVITSWLAAVTRRELSRFREFISWLRYGKRNFNHLVIAIYRTHLETTAANPTNDASPTPRHDILEVNNYFISGLVVSSIDKWFMGPVPQFLPKDLGVTGNEQGSATVLQRARAVTQDPAQVAWQFVRRIQASYNSGNNNRNPRTSNRRI
jgi:anaphase-promoting complex subunit 4